nr:hypothetical protein [Tanacetum cinerariifolium]
ESLTYAGNPVKEILLKVKSILSQIDQNAKIVLDDETQGRTNDDEMFRVDDLAREVVMETTTGVKDNAAPITDVVIQEQEMSTTIPAAATIVTTAVPTLRAKGKAKIIEPEVPIKRKEHIRINEEYARKLEAEEQEAASLSRAQQDKEANNSWDYMKAMMDANRLLAKKLQAREREEFSEGWSFDEIKKLFDREMTKVDENVEPTIDDSEELRKCIEIVPDDGDEVLIEATPISSRSPTIIDYQIYKEGKKTYFKIIRADGNSQVYQTFKKMFKNFNKEDLEVLWDIVKDRFKKE